MTVVINRETPGDSEAGLRERKKAEKGAAIREAAAALFQERGYDATTTQAVAERAGIAKGTLFLYATSKADLVALVFEDRIRRTAAEALALAPQASIAADLDAIFARFFAMYGREPDLARLFVKELVFAEGQARRVREEIEGAFLGGLAARIEGRKGEGVVRADVLAPLAAASAFALYLSALVAWLGGIAPSADAARAHLRASLELLMRGLAPREEESSCIESVPLKTKARSRSAKRARSTSKRGASATVATKRRGSR